MGLQLDFFLHFSLIPDCLVGSGPTYDSTVELGWVMCHGLKRGILVQDIKVRDLIHFSSYLTI